MGILLAAKSLKIVFRANGVHYRTDSKSMLLYYYMYDLSRIAFKKIERLLPYPL